MTPSLERRRARQKHARFLADCVRKNLRLIVAGSDVASETFAFETNLSALEALAALSSEDATRPTGDKA